MYHHSIQYKTSQYKYVAGDKFTLGYSPSTFCMMDVLVNCACQQPLSRTLLRDKKKMFKLFFHPFAQGALSYCATLDDIHQCLKKKILPDSPLVQYCYLVLENCIASFNPFYTHCEWEGRGKKSLRLCTVFISF